jgi:hypothetical protein
VGVNNGIHLGARLEDIEVKPPFARRPLPRIEAAIQAHENDLLGLHRLVGDACRRNQHPLVMAQADISGRTLVDTQLVHTQAGVDDGLALFPIVCGGHQ